jgi:NIPSNAP
MSSRQLWNLESLLATKMTNESQSLLFSVLRREDVPMLYLQASLKLRAGKLEDFVSMLNKLTPVLGRHGMKLTGSYASVIGRLNTVVDFWELTSADVLQRALADPEVAKYGPLIAEIIEDETLTLLNKLPVG